MFARKPKRNRRTYFRFFRTSQNHRIFYRTWTRGLGTRSACSAELNKFIPRHASKDIRKGTLSVQVRIRLWAWWMQRTQPFLFWLGNWTGIPELQRQLRRRMGTALFRKIVDSKWLPNLIPAFCGYGVSSPPYVWIIVGLFNPPKVKVVHGMEKMLLVWGTRNFPYLPLRFQLKFVFLRIIKILKYATYASKRWELM